MKSRNERHRKKVTSIEDSDIFVKNVTEIIENKTKEQIAGMLLSLLGASNNGKYKELWQTMQGKGGVIRAGKEATRQDSDGVLTAGQNF